MPRIKRYFPVSHELLDDPEVWNLCAQFGDRSLRLWLYILSHLDRSENRWRLPGQWLASVSRATRQTPASVRSAVGWMVASGWLVADGDLAGVSPIVLSAPNYAKYHRTQVHNGNESCADEGTNEAPLLTKPNLTKTKPPISPKGSVSKEAPTHDGDLFEKIWTAYPAGRRGRVSAVKAWTGVKVENGVGEKMLAALEAWKQTEQWQKDGGKFIPFLSTWLNQRRWNDELPSVESVPTGTGKVQQADWW